MAHVHVVIVGLVKRADEAAVKRLFSYEDITGNPSETQHTALTPYLFDAGLLANRHLVVYRATVPLGTVPKPRVGSKPVDHGHYIIDSGERTKLVSRHPEIAPYIRPYIGGEEYLNGGDRWIFCLQKAKPEQLRKWPEVMQRIELVRKFREKDGGNLSKSLALTPLAFHVTVIPEAPFLAIPEVSSERREYVPIGWLQPPVVPSNKIIVIEKPEIWLWAIISSKMHMAWLRHIGGRLESRYQYSGGIVYNTFPWPEATPAQKQKIELLGQAILTARANYPDATLADLYDPDTMPPDLRKAHKTLDTAIDKLYRPAGFTSDRERVEHLFTLYEKLTAPALAAMAAPKPKRRPHQKT